ncbi:MAG: polyprenyl synthetase family protein [Candidatus Micrarchaeota archaeon]|nr:polyprenyl synthetase family protein [Candidatus Micrarchaeota archaeon]MDE1849505.1 polyprenyl synthetase family protein [Candidatus Micrarchaeota archaeon]
MNFKEYIEVHRKAIYSRICEYIPLKEPVEHYKIVREYSDRQGSYRRPALLMLSGQMFGAKPEELVLPAAAMQLSEDWILIHDDIEDHSDMRRGKPTLHKIYGAEISINAGDAAHMAMWKMANDYVAKVGIEKGKRFFDKFYKILEHTVEGQYLEDNFIYNVRDLSRASEELYYKIIDAKTCCYTVYGPMQLGAIVAGQPDSTLETLEHITKPAGRAFQIVDDVLDMTADEKVFGKKRYGDLYEGKITLMVLHAYSKAAENERAELNRIYGKDREQKTKNEIEYIVGMIQKYKSLEYAQNEAAKYREQARQAVEQRMKDLPNNEYTPIMMSAMGELSVRHK